MLCVDTDLEIPEPDYSDSDDGQPPHYRDDHAVDADDEIQSQLLNAKKLVNPCLESKQHKAVCKELIFNQKLYAYTVTVHHGPFAAA